MKEKNNIAVIGFVFSILSLMCFGITSFVGLILSIIALLTYKKYIKGLKKLAMAGLIISLVGFIFFWVYLFVTTIIPNHTSEEKKNTININVDLLDKTDKYNGVYSFDTGTLKSVLEISGNSFKMNYMYNTLSEPKLKTIKGVAGIDSNTQKYYIAFEDEYDDGVYNIYNCRKKDSGLLCDNKSEFGFDGYDTLLFDKYDGNFDELSNQIVQEQTLIIENRKAEEVKKQAEEEEQKKTNEESKKQAETEKEKQKEEDARSYELEVNSETLVDTYYNNELDGNKKYFGKKIKTNGRFIASDHGFITGWSVSFSTDGVYNLYCSSFVEGEEKHFSEYNRGETLTIYATVDELVGNSLKLNKCHIER